MPAAPTARSRRATGRAGRSGKAERAPRSRGLARADAMQLDVGGADRDAVVELRTAASAVRQQVLARAPALVDVDAAAIEQVGTEREVDAPRRAPGVRQYRDPRPQERLALRGIDVDRAGDDDRHPATLAAASVVVAAAASAAA